MEDQHRVNNTAAESTTEDKSQLIQGGMSSPEAHNEFAPLQMEDQKKRGHCNPGGLQVIVISAVSFSVVVTVALILTIFLGPTQVLLHQAVSSDSAECSTIGTSIIEEGGSSVDAAVATTLCISVVQPTDSSLGGGGFMIIRDNAGKETHVIDFMAAAPSGATEDMFDNDASAAKRGGQAVAVPGLLKGLKEAHDSYGSLSWKKVVEPSIRLARDGFNVTAKLANALSSLDASDYPSLASGFTTDGSAWVTEGDTLKQPELASLLESIASEGIESVYTGTIAEGIKDTVQQAGGILNVDDMRSYKVVTPTAIHVPFMNQTVETISAPSGGPIVLAALNILTNFEWTNSSSDQAISFHHIIEGVKYAFGQRGVLGDPYLIPSVTSSIESIMTNITFGQETEAKITASNKTVETGAYGTMTGVSMPEGTAGSTVTVFGRKEEMVAVSTSLGGTLGSGLVTPSGILLNSLMSFFNIPSAPAQPNNIAPGKRPVTPLAPTVTYSAEKPCSRRMALGGGGGMEALAGITEVLLRVVGFRESLEAAIGEERISDIMDGSGVHYETGLDTPVVSSLTSFGHTLVEEATPFNLVNAVAKINETVEAFADTRGGGEADVI